MKNIKFGRGYVEIDLTSIERYERYQAVSRSRYQKITIRREEFKSNFHLDPGIVNVPYISQLRTTITS